MPGHNKNQRMGPHGQALRTLAITAALLTGAASAQAALVDRSKYTLGTELRDVSRSVLMQVLRANNASDQAARSAELLVLRGAGKWAD